MSCIKYFYGISYFCNICKDNIDFIQHVEPDKDGLYNGMTLPYSHSRIILYFSSLSMASSIYAIYRHYYDLAVVPFTVFVTSIIYWVKPDYSWRRYLDEGLVTTVLIYQCSRAVYAENRTHYYIITSAAVCFFPIGIYFHKKHSWISTIAHIFIHILGNIANIILYSGKISNDSII
jgi:hypothetical protein